MKNNFSIIISNTTRSLQYIIHLKKNNFVPKNIIYFDYGTKKINLKKKYFNGSKVKKFKTNYINSKVSKFILSLKEKFIIYSGYPGIIEKNKKVLKTKKLIHSHSGKLPNFKGSTAIYYSILKEKNIFCSTIILNKNLDDGEILLQKKYPIPRNILDIDNEYDDFIRAQNIIFLLKNFDKLKIKKKRKKTFSHYYVIHPILRSIVFRKYEKNF